MLSSCSSHSLSRRPILAPSLSKYWVQNRPGHFSLNRSYRIFESNPKLTKKKWKFSCFWHEGFSPENTKSEYIEHFLREELVQPEFVKSSAHERDWKSTLREAADAVLRAVGSRWTVPWTAETILRVVLFFLVFCSNIFAIRNWLRSFCRC